MGGWADKPGVAFRLKWWWRVGRQWAAGVCLIAGAMGWACGTESGPGPQRLAEDQIKAGFLFNFTRFVEWSQAPQQAPFTPVVLCIVDDPGIADLLSAASVGKVVNGRTVTIRRGRVGEEFRGCNVVFVGDTSERHAAQIVEGVKGANVLTVGEAQGSRGWAGW